MDLRPRLREQFRWRGDSTDEDLRADLTNWWRDPEVLIGLGPALANLFPATQPTVVMGPQSRGCLLGALVARHLEVGFVEVHKDPGRAADSDAWWERTTPPDYRDRNLVMGVRRNLLSAGDRVLFVDDWVATGGQAVASKALVHDSGASWLGAAVVVNGLDRPQHRHDLGLKSLLHLRDL